MTEVISVKFRGRGKTYFFAPGEIQVPDGEQVVVETAKGMELAECVKGNHYVLDERVVPPLRPVIRLANADDKRIGELCRSREKDAFRICEEKIAQHGLDMKLVDVECNFEGNKILFFFTSDGRVDFRELVKDLAGIFRTRIELRQIGVRDEAKMLGGLGICGRPFCCNQFLDDFQPVSTKMAKTQSLSLNPAKISGACGRLMCCLRYEQEAYEELVKGVPKNGAFVETPVGYGNIAQVNLLRQKVKVRLDGGDESLKSFDADEVAAVPGGRPKPGEPLPHVLTVKPKEVKPEEEAADQWALPDLFGEQMHEEKAAEGEEAPAAEKKSGRSRSRNRRRSRHGGEKSAQNAPEKAAEKAAAPDKQAEKKPQPAEKPVAGGESGEKKSGRSRSRNRHRKSGGNKSADGAQTAQQSARPQTPSAPKASGEGEKSGEGGEKKKRRRYYRPRNDGGKAQG